jgi:hypothetical protein
MLTAGNYFICTPWHLFYDSEVVSQGLLFLRQDFVMGGSNVDLHRREFTG